MELFNHKNNVLIILLFIISIKNSIQFQENNEFIIVQNGSLDNDETYGSGIEEQFSIDSKTDTDTTVVTQMPGFYIIMISVLSKHFSY